MSLDPVLAAISREAGWGRYHCDLVQAEGVHLADDLRALGFEVTATGNTRERLIIKWAAPVDMFTLAGQIHRRAKSAELTDDEVERMVAEIRAELTLRDGQRVIKYAIDRFARPAGTPLAMVDRRVVSRIEALGYIVYSGSAACPDDCWCGVAHESYQIVKAPHSQNTK